VLYLTIKIVNLGIQFLRAKSCTFQTSQTLYNKYSHFTRNSRDFSIFGVGLYSRSWPIHGSSSEKNPISVESPHNKFLKITFARPTMSKTMALPTIVEESNLSINTTYEETVYRSNTSTMKSHRSKLQSFYGVQTSSSDLIKSDLTVSDLRFLTLSGKLSSDSSLTMKSEGSAASMKHSFETPHSFSAHCSIFYFLHTFKLK
jgi:hypothetical protein